MCAVLSFTVWTSQSVDSTMWALQTLQSPHIATLCTHSMLSVRQAATCCQFVVYPLWCPPCSRRVLSVCTSCTTPYSIQNHHKLRPHPDFIEIASLRPLLMCGEFDFFVVFLVTKLGSQFRVWTSERLPSRASTVTVRLLNGIFWILKTE